MELSDWMGKNQLSNVLASQQPHIILFAADWCGYCSRFIELVKNTSNDYAQKISLVNTDDTDETLWDTYRIRLVPTLVVMHGGKEVMRREGRVGSGLRQDDLQAAVQAASEAK
ncbi:MAG: thioredoxin family protein [Thaumarchaeota archaeon]|nr:thioredoxin family protein [Nitrososphaerota archaeon]MDG6908380.1 thioredoxin family protein [Nitrososphaerota archaeon]